MTVMLHIGSIFSGCCPEASLRSRFASDNAANAPHRTALPADAGQQPVDQMWQGAPFCRNRPPGSRFDALFRSCLTSLSEPLLRQRARCIPCGTAYPAKRHSPQINEFCRKMRIRETIEKRLTSHDASNPAAVPHSQISRTSLSPPHPSRMQVRIHWHSDGRDDFRCCHQVPGRGGFRQPPPD